ncbi:RICIN domain-containing protein [Streptomyces sp. NPDC018693]
MLDNGNAEAEGSQVIQWTANGGSPQRWTLTRIG